MLTYLQRLGAVLREARTERGLTQADMAAALNITQSMWSRYEVGASSLSVEQLKLISLRMGMENAAGLLIRVEYVGKGFDPKLDSFAGKVI